MVTSGPKGPNYPLEYYPRLDPSNSRVTSPVSEDYNCLAWAVEIDCKNFWPPVEDILPEPAIEWPDGLPIEETVEAFVAFFELFGYEVCDGPEFEDEAVKIAIFVDHGGIPTHACRQVPSTKSWASKMGWDGVDVELDDLGCIEGVTSYGTAKVFMKKAWQN